jgi:hypothetical protein
MTKFEPALIRKTLEYIEAKICITVTSLLSFALWRACTGVNYHVFLSL